MYPSPHDKQRKNRLASVNQITSGYDLEISDDYEAIDDADIAEILQRIETATNALSDSEVERVMAGVREETNKTTQPGYDRTR